MKRWMQGISLKGMPTIQYFSEFLSQTFHIPKKDHEGNTNDGFECRNQKKKKKKMLKTKDQMIQKWI